MTVWFDVEDLFRFATESRGRRTTGIQRLTLELYGALESLAGGTERIGFVRHGGGRIPYRRVPWHEIASQFLAQADTAEPGDDPAPDMARADRAGVRGKRRTLASWVPDRIRKPLVKATVTQARAVFELGRFGLHLVIPRSLVRRVRGGAPAAAAQAPTDDVIDRFRPGDVLFVLGTPWFRQEYAALARWLRDDRRMRFGLLVYDLVPVRHPEWSHHGTVRLFRNWYSSLLPFCDVVLAISRFTAADVEAFAREQRLALAGPVVTIPLGTGFGPEAAHSRPVRRYRDHPEPGTYVLFVSTMEARKNHTLAFRLWIRLLDEVRAGVRPAGSVPTLVFAGRIGWLVADLVAQLENTDWLDGSIRLIDSPTDGELRALYAGCLFTFYPSFHEGWGLPVTESLAAGKPCLCSNAASLPEAGGDLCRYFDPEDLEGALRSLVAVLDDRPGLAAWEARVRREFRPVSWRETAEFVLKAASSP